MTPNEEKEALRDKWKMVDADCRDGNDGLITHHVSAFDEGFNAARSQDQAQIAILRKELELRKQTHYECEDSWYSCPQSDGGCADEHQGTECNCGANKINSKIDSVLSATQQSAKAFLAEHAAKVLEETIAGIRINRTVVGDDETLSRREYYLRGRYDLLDELRFMASEKRKSAEHENGKGGVK